MNITIDNDFDWSNRLRCGSLSETEQTALLAGKTLSIQGPFAERERAIARISDWAKRRGHRTNTTNRKSETVAKIRLRPVSN